MTATNAPRHGRWTAVRHHVAKVFVLNRTGVNVPRAVVAAGLLLVTLVVMTALHQEKYFLSAAFALLFVGLSDSGGDYRDRLRGMALVGLIGALLTALGFGIGGGAWGFVVLATFGVTVLGGLAINFGPRRFVAGVLLNVWFLITLSEVAGLPARADPHQWEQALAWLIGSGIWIAFTFALWLAHGRRSRPSPLPEIPDDVPPIKLTRPVVSFVLLRALTVSGTVAIAFGLHVSSADWMPLAALVAMKPNLQQSVLRAEQRLFGALLGAGIASLFLVTVNNKHGLEEVFIILMAAGIAIYAVNYAFYAAAIAGSALIAIDLPNPTNLGAEGRRVLFTFIGVGIAVVVMFLATLLQRRKASTAAARAD